MHLRATIGVTAGCLAALSMTGTTQAHEIVAGEMVIRFDQQPTTEMLDSIENLVGEVDWYAPKHAPFARGTRDAHPLSFVRVARLGDGVDLQNLLEVVGSAPGVDFATTNNRPEPAHVPNDPMYNQQWSHTKINTETAWDISTGDTSVIVGIIDTGAVVDHEDLIDHMWINDDPINGIDDDNNGFIDDLYGWDFDNNNNNVDDVYGHGTQVSGIVGGKIDNGIGIAGIANLTVMQAKWWHNGGSDMSVAESVYYAVDNGASVLNLSLSCGCLLPLTEDAINYAYANDVVTVCSSGNSGSQSTAYPSGYANAMAIGAVDVNDQRPGFSNYGSHLDVTAPSPDILSTGPGSPTDYDVDFRGTSAAAPHVAGLAGFIRAVDPSLTADEVRALINDNATDLGAPGFDIHFGNGRIDVGATIGAIAPACAADLDDSGDVGIGDLLELLAQWGPCAACSADLDNSGAVDIGDLLELLSLWGPC